MKKIPIIILTGPTAVGKTNLSIDLAKELNAEIISADSMQIYKYMDIGSAKVTIDEMQGVKHYLVDEVTPDYVFSVSEFQKRADDYIEKINDENTTKYKYDVLIGEDYKIIEDNKVDCREIKKFE